MRKLPRRRREDGGDAEAPAVVDRVGKIAHVVDGGVSGRGSQRFVLRLLDRYRSAEESETGTAARDGSPPSPPLFPVVGTSGTTSGSSSGSRLGVSEET